MSRITRRSSAHFREWRKWDALSKWELGTACLALIGTADDARRVLRLALGSDGDLVELLRIATKSQLIHQPTESIEDERNVA